MRWMKGWKKGIGILIVSATCAGRSQAAMMTTVTETFDGTLAEATWRLGTLDEIVADGGSPGSYLRNPQLDTAVPTPMFVGPAGSPFLGDYRSRRVAALGLDVQVFAAEIGVDNRRPISLVLGSDMGTPDDPSDDCEAYRVGAKSVPRPGTGWHSYDFKVPSDQLTLPAGWTVRGFCAGFTQDQAWNAVLGNVTRVSFPFADPDTFWYFQVWDVGIDSVRVTSGGRRPTLEGQ